MNNELIRRAMDVNQAWLALGNDVFDIENARFVRNRDAMAKRDSNHVQAVRASTADEIDRLLAAADREFAGFPHRAFYIEHPISPAFEARLQLDGYERDDALVMLLEGELAGQPKPHEIRRVESEADWAAYAELQELDWIGNSRRPNVATASWNPGVSLHAIRLKSPPIRTWLAYADGRPAAYFSSWEGVDGVGQVEDLFTHADLRHRGLATALLHHCVADARAHGAGPVVIVCDPGDTPKHMYAALGFRPVAVKRAYWKNVS